MTARLIRNVTMNGNMTTGLWFKNTGKADTPILENIQGLDTVFTRGAGGESVLLRFRHPTAAPIQNVIVNGKTCTAFDKDKEMIEIKGLTGTVRVTARY